MQLLPIGRFSQACRLSIKALRNYDELGLLAPAWVDPDSGYRYYTMAQCNRAEAIRLLRALDMPLDEIRSLLDETDPAVVAARLAEYRARVEQRLVTTQRILGFLQQLIDRKEGVMPYEVKIREVPDQTVLAITARDLDMRNLAPVFGQILGELYGYIGRSGIEPQGPPFAIYRGLDNDAPSDVLPEMQLCVPIGARPAGEPGGRIEVVDMPGCATAYTVHHGPYHELRPAYSALYGWIEEHGHLPGDAPREVYLNDPGQVDESELLTEIVWPLEQ
jgi:effector-binding domain-containing protein/DNA-binding transcriptional MerR regulator